MSEVTYTYSVLKYRHDAAAGEVLNVGVVLFTRETGQVGLEYDHRYARLSEAFAHFDGDQYRAVLTRLERALATMAKPMAEGLYQLEERERFADVGALLSTIWPDQGLSYYAGPVMSGLTADQDQELASLFDRFVLSQYDRREPGARFGDEDLWSEFRKVLTSRGITGLLQPKSLGPAEVEFEHAYKNERWHVIEPVSLDYRNPADMKQKALTTLGKATAMREVEDFGSFTVLVGKPRRVEAEKKYVEAMRLLQELPVPHRIVEEDHAEQYAEDLRGELVRHGLLSA
jgi:hypothetical protein